MPTEILRPNGISFSGVPSVDGWQNNAFGAASLSDINDNSDGTYFDSWRNAGDYVGLVLLDFPTPTDELSGTQTFYVRHRKRSSGYPNFPSNGFDLYEGGSPVTLDIGTFSSTSTTASTASGTWGAGDVANADGSAVQCQVYLGGEFYSGEEAYITTSLVDVWWDAQYSTGPSDGDPGDTEYYHLDMPTPEEVPYGQQAIIVRAQELDGGPGASQGFEVFLYENDVEIRSLGTQASVTSSATNYSFYFDASELSDPTGAGVEIRIVANTVYKYSAFAAFSAFFIDIWWVVQSAVGIEYGLLRPNGFTANTAGRWLSAPSTDMVLTDVNDDSDSTFGYSKKAP